MLLLLSHDCAATLLASHCLFVMVAWQLWATQEGSRAVSVRLFDFKLDAAAAIAALPQVSQFFSVCSYFPYDSSLSMVLTVL